MKKQNDSPAPAINEQTMTSLEIAEVTGKNHAHLLRDIRKMERGWEKVRQSKFGLSYYDQKMPTGGTKKRPMYSLNEWECLYVSTKFNDEQRAKLVLYLKALKEAHDEQKGVAKVEAQMEAIRHEQYSLAGRITNNKRKLKHLRAAKKIMMSNQLSLGL